MQVLGRVNGICEDLHLEGSLTEHSQSLSQLTFWEASLMVVPLAWPGQDMEFCQGELGEWLLQSVGMPGWCLNAF